MNERQYNSKLISDKLSEIPVPANDLLWSKIETQLSAVPPHATQAPDNTLLQSSAVTKAGVIKTAIILLSSVIVIVFVIWMIGKFNQPKKPVPARQIPQLQIADSAATVTAKNSSFQPQKKVLPAVMPVTHRDTGNKITDTEMAYPALVPLEKHTSLPLADSIKMNITGTIQISPDTVKLNAPAPQKKEEDYYFDIQKKKKGN